MTEAATAEINQRLSTAPPTTVGSEQTVSGARKAAITLIALGTEAASLVLKNMRDDEVEKITVEIARARNISSDVVESVLMEFRDMGIARDYVAQGGVSFAREALESALGPRSEERRVGKGGGARAAEG